MSLHNLFNRPIVVPALGEVYSIQLKDWDEFEECLSVLMLSKANFPIEDESIPLLDRLIAYSRSNPYALTLLTKAFNLVTRSDSFQFVVIQQGIYYFQDKEGRLINPSNYDEFRKVVLHQNILIEPKVFKNPLLAEWASDVLKVKSKDSANISLEDMLSTVSVFKGKDYDELEKYTIYQLKTDFQRIQQIKQYETTALLLGNPYAASEVKLTHFAEFLDLYADPYADVFKSKSNMNVNQAFQ